MAIKDLNKEEVEALVKSAQEGNTEAFAKIYDMYVDAIFRYMSFKVGKEEALDLTENVFLKVWENIWQRLQEFSWSWFAVEVFFLHFRDG